MSAAASPQLTRSRWIAPILLLRRNSLLRTGASELSIQTGSLLLYLFAKVVFGLCLSVPGIAASFPVLVIAR